MKEPAGNGVGIADGIPEKPIDIPAALFPGQCLPDREKRADLLNVLRGA